MVASKLMAYSRSALLVVIVEVMFALACFPLWAWLIGPKYIDVVGPIILIMIALTAFTIGFDMIGRTFFKLW